MLAPGTGVAEARQMTRSERSLLQQTLAGRLRRCLSALLVCLTLIFAGVGAGYAAGFDDAQRWDLTQRVTSFEERFRAGDILAIAEAMPAKVLAEIAREFDADPAETHAEMLKAMRETMDQVRYDHFAIDHAGAEEQTTPSDAAYLLMPTETVVVSRADGRKARLNAHILAFIDEDEWVLINVGSERISAVVASAYPQFAGVTFPLEEVVFEGYEDVAQ